MKKITNFLLTLLTVLTVITSGINVASADDSCDHEAIRRDIAKTVETTASQLRTSLESYNRATKNFETSCGEITQFYRGATLSFSLRTLQQALAFNKSKYSYLTDMSQYEDTGIDWGRVPTNKKECEDLKVKAWVEQDHYTSLYTKAVIVFGIAANETSLPLSCVCPEGSNEQQCTAYTSAKMEEQKTGDKCDTFATYLSSLSSCPLCPIFQAVLNTDAKLASVSWRALASSLQSVVMVFFLIYLALETLKIVSNLVGSSISSYLKSVFTLGFKVLMTYFLLDNSSYIYGYFISPVLQAGLDMGTALVSISSSQASICLANNANVDFVSTPGGVLDAGLLDNIMRTVRCYGHTATIMPAVGKGLICHGWANDGSLLPDFGTWLSGILFFLFGLIIWLVVSFYLIDCTIQLGMLCGIIPVLVACWPFKATQRFSLKGINLLMNTFFNYIMLGIVLLLGVEIVNFATGKKNGSIDVFMEALNDNNLAKIREVASLDGMEILMLVICCIFAFKLIENTNKLADKFSTGVGMNIASKIGGLASSAAVATVATGGQIGAHVGEAMLEQTGLSGKFTDLGNTAKDTILNAASDFGKKIGLAEYQPQAMTARRYTPAENEGDRAGKETSTQTSTTGQNNTAMNENTEIKDTENSLTERENETASGIETKISAEQTSGLNPEAPETGSADFQPRDTK